MKLRLPSDEERFWRESLAGQSFYMDGLSFSDSVPALTLGHMRFRDDTLFEDIQCRLSGEWDRIKGTSRLTWLEARHAAHAAWDRAAERLDRSVSARA
jgi:hypothetical protein